MFHIQKQTRLYDGTPYCGPSSDNEEMAFSYLSIALESAKILQAHNPVGWNIWDAETGKLVEGVDYFKE